MNRVTVRGAVVPLTAEEIAAREAEAAAMPPAPRRITAAAFVALFTPAEIAACVVVPDLLAGALEAAAQGSVNLDSPRTAALLDLAVAAEAISEARRDQILAGQPPGE